MMTNCVTNVRASITIRSAEEVADLELVRRTKAGETEAFGQLVAKYRNKIFTFVYGMVRNEHDAWDLAQEAFLTAWRSSDQFEGRSSFYTWLHTVTKNVTFSFLRRKGHRQEVELNETIPSALPGPDADYQRSEIRERVNAAIANLSPEQRTVLVLKELEGLEYHEIAELLNLPIGTVMSRLFYARRNLRSLLESAYSHI
ncbi:MAG TPA: sigma-70 family RNA polymerase sigma factor [Chthoniobacterales bacterium]|nr:sigma-70 family RNA polymerase sigma factor [Chthoniobacterales bacterium]